MSSANDDNFGKVSEYINSKNFDSMYKFNDIVLNQKSPENDVKYEIQNLGISLYTKEPLFPDIYYIASENPLINKGQFDCKEEYVISVDKVPRTDVKTCNDELLIFLFYIHCGEKIQNDAAEELHNRGYTYRNDIEQWTKNGKNFDPIAWK